MVATKSKAAGNVDSGQQIIKFGRLTEFTNGRQVLMM